MEGLLDKAQAGLDEARKEEDEAIGAFELTKQSLNALIMQSNFDLTASKNAVSEAGEVKATAQGDLDVTTKDLNADIKALNTVHHDCMTKASDFELETTSRGEELKALATAKKIIQE